MADEDIELILDICLYRGENLVVGSVASPQIANMLMYAFDLELKQMLDGFGSFRYTRYADDIVISSMSFIDEPGFEADRTVNDQVWFQDES